MICTMMRTTSFAFRTTHVEKNYADWEEQQHKFLERLCCTHVCKKVQVHWKATMDQLVKVTCALPPPPSEKQLLRRRRNSSSSAWKMLSTWHPCMFVKSISFSSRNIAFFSTGQEFYELAYCVDSEHGNEKSRNLHLCQEFINSIP